MIRKSASIASLIVAISFSMFAGERPDPNVPQGKNLDVPIGWKVRTDHAGEPVIGADKETADIWFVNMTPGWHITTKPAAIFYHPASTASGNYRAETVIHLFDPKGRNEAYGIFFGGADLEGDGQVYDYFLLRNSGEYLIKQRRGSETKVVRDWTKHEGVVRWEKGMSSAENRLAVECREGTVDFFINGEKVVSIERAKLRTDGIVGLRFNHRLDAHVSDLSVTPLD